MNNYRNVPAALPPELLDFFESMTQSDQGDLKNAAKVSRTSIIDSDDRNQYEPGKNYLLVEYVKTISICAG